MGIIARIWAQPADRIAIRTGASAVSYGRLIADVDTALAAFRKDGLMSGSTIGIRVGHAENGHSYANWVAHLAAVKLGATHISMTDKSAIKAGLQAGRIDRVIGNFESLIDVPLSVRRLQFHSDPAGPSPVADAQPNDEGSTRRLNLTSGTTGKPKFVAWDAEMIERRVDQVAEGGVADGGTVLFPLLHLRTTAGFRYPLAVWVRGGCVLLPAARTGLDRDKEALPTCNLITCSPPQLKERLAGIPGTWPGKEKRTILLLGGRLPAGMRDAALDRACSRLLITYGSTETGSISIGEHDVIARHPGAVGYVRPGVQVEIVTPGGGMAKPGQPGLIRTRTPMMAESYEEGQAPAGGAHFRDGWFYPGDVGRLFDDGLLAIEGRTGDTLNVGGWKVGAVDLEARVAELPGVRDVCAVAMQLPDGDILTFGIVCDDGTDLNSIRVGIRDILSRRRRFNVIRLPGIPRNAMGKIPRALIASRLAAVYGAMKKSAANA